LLTEFSFPAAGPMKELIPLRQQLAYKTLQEYV
jgi:hypothetical protein